ncbi:MAG: amidohydrolase [Chloroflexi bacterium]|nr:amidohydrolase [Chloroflexota bacterium]
MPTDKHIELIDADGHVLETPDAWTARIEPKYRDQAPRIRLINGKDIWFVEDHPLFEATLEEPAAIGGAAGEDLESLRKKGRRYLQNPAGGFYPDERIKVLDAEGMARAVLYPTTGLFTNHGRMRDTNLVTAAAHAYNDWIADYCRAHPSRLHAAAQAPLHDVEAACTEIRRAVERLGLRAAFTRPAPHVGNRPLNDVVYDPFWATLQELGVPLALHPGVGEELPSASRFFQIFGERPSQRRPGQGISFSQGLGNPMDMIVSLGWLILGGVLERYPRLKVVVLESGGGWAQPVLERMDHHYKVFPYELTHLSMKPSDYFKRQVWISFDPDEKMLPITAELLGADRVVWASDYPHPDAKYPGCGDEVREVLDRLPATARSLIGGDNARALYGLS